MKNQVLSLAVITLTALLLLAIPENIHAQSRNIPVKWGKVSAEDLAMTSYDKDPDADVLVLFDFATINVNLRQDYAVSYSFYVRKKILTQEGVDEVDISIPYGVKEQIIGLEAQTINGDKKIKVKRKNIFTEEVNKNFNRENFTFSDVQVGSIIEYRYTLQSPYFATLDSWYFQSDGPVRHSECRLTIPDYLEYVVITNLDKSFDLKDSWNTTIGTDPAITLRFVMNDVASMKEESYITTMADYLNKIEFQLVELTRSDGSKDRFMKDWDDLVKSWINHEKGGRQYNYKANHKKILTAAEAQTEGITDPLEKAKALHNFIKTSFNWNKRFNDYIDASKLSAAYEKRTGNSAVLNLSLLACLQNAGIEAYPIRISTRRHGKIQKVYPIVSQFNHIAILAIIDGKEYLLDALHEGLTFGMLHPSALNQEGLLMRKSKNQATEWVKLAPTKTDEIVNINLSIEEDESKAEMTSVYTGYRSLNRRISHENSDEEDYIENRLGDTYDFEVENVTFNTEKPERFGEEMTLIVEDAVTNAGDNIYINPFLMEQTETRPFTLEKRTYPVDIAYPYTEKYILNLKIPEGYEVETQPEDIKMTLPDSSGSYLYLIKVSNGVLQLRCEETLKKPIYLPEEYKALKNFFDQIFDKEAEQIILKKKA